MWYTTESRRACDIVNEMFEARNHQVDDLPFEAGDVIHVHPWIESSLASESACWMSSQLGGIHISGLPILSS